MNGIRAVLADLRAVKGRFLALVAAYLGAFAAN
jgi:hypothetical protein